MPDPHYAMSSPIPLAQTDFVLRKQFDLPCADHSPAQKLDIYWTASCAHR